MRTRGGPKGWGYWTYAKRAIRTDPEETMGNYTFDQSVLGKDSSDTNRSRILRIDRWRNEQMTPFGNVRGKSGAEFIPRFPRAIKSRYFWFIFFKENSDAPRSFYGNVSKYLNHLWILGILVAGWLFPIGTNKLVFSYGVFSVAVFDFFMLKICQ